MIRNPILRGFNPDPSIVRVGGDYYIATSTFEWMPGVQIHHSRNLADWTLVARPLRRAAQLDLRGVPDSCGVWAPCLTHARGLFHLVYTVVRRYGRTTTPGTSTASLRDFHNYLVTSPTIDGEWSDPIHLNSSGFDPSLFHDEDGRSYLLNMRWDHRPGHNHFGGIILQEYDHDRQALVGEPRLIFEGTLRGLTEGPHLYRRGGYYHLLTAEGGTGWNHAVTMARSRDLFGPYELHPDIHVLDVGDRPDWPLQRAGHGDLVETPQGETYMVYLCGRPLAERGRCVLGRETAIQRMTWADDGWLYTDDGRGLPMLEEATRVDAEQCRAPESPTRDDFDGPALGPDWQWLRTPDPDRIFSLSERPGHLRLFGRETIGSQFEQALVARRQDVFRYSAATSVDAQPFSFQQAAGLVCYYNATKFHYLFVSHDEIVGRHVRLMSSFPDRQPADHFSVPIPVDGSGPIELRADIDRHVLRLAWRREGEAAWNWLPDECDSSILSDEATIPGLPNFTGAFVGIACQDGAGAGAGFTADFDWFDYRPTEGEV